MKIRLGLPGLAVLLTVTGCSEALLKEGDYAALPPQPAVTGTPAAPTAVVIVLPPEIYKTIPPRNPDSPMATEAQLETIENYGLYLSADDRETLEDLVNDCRFTAHDSCTIQAAETPAKS